MTLRNQAYWILRGSALSLRIFRGTALPGGVFAPKTAVGHRQEPGGTEKFSSSVRTLHETPIVFSCRSPASAAQYCHEIQRRHGRTISRRTSGRSACRDWRGARRHSQESRRRLRGGNAVRHDRLLCAAPHLSGWVSLRPETAVALRGTGVAEESHGDLPHVGLLRLMVPNVLALYRQETGHGLGLHPLQDARRCGA